jgi:hypothetical protein
MLYTAAVDDEEDGDDSEQDETIQMKGLLKLLPDIDQFTD